MHHRSIINPTDVRPAFDVKCEYCCYKNCCSICSNNGCSCVLKFASVGDAERCLMWCSKCSKRSAHESQNATIMSAQRKNTTASKHVGSNIAILPLSPSTGPIALSAQKGPLLLHSRRWRSGTRAILAPRGAALRESRERPKVTS
jgi:hypothetical protein